MRKKAINFDLSTTNLKKFYPKSNYREAYKDIKKFLCNKGFKHRQWSGYISEKPMSDSKVNAIITDLTIEFPWLKKCVEHFDVTDIGKQHDLTHVITGTKESKAIKLSASDRQKENPPQQEKKPRMTMSRSQTKAVAQKVAAKPREQKEKSKDKGMER